MDLTSSGCHVVLVGGNGAGKTNLLEAISMLAPGRGLRQAKLEEMVYRANCKSSQDHRFGYHNGWRVSAMIASGDAGLGGNTDTKIGVALETTEGRQKHREIKVNGASVSNAIVLVEYITLLWLTPAMDSLFLGPASERRRFLNRLVMLLDSSYGARVLAYEKVMRHRNRLLREGRYDSAWLSALEVQMSELGALIAQYRVEAIQRLMTLIAECHEEEMIFPPVHLSLAGELEIAISDGVSLSRVIEDYQSSLENMRCEDRAAGRTLYGPHLTDLRVTYGSKNMPAKLSSTGEQKAMLIGLILAQARFVSVKKKSPPVLLLDEVTAHLDGKYRDELFKIINSIGGQCWMTGTEASMFKSISDQADIIILEPGSESSSYSV